MQEQSQQLDEVIVYISILLLNADDVGQIERPIKVEQSIGRLGPREESKLKAIFHNHCNLQGDTVVRKCEIFDFNNLLARSGAREKDRYEINVAVGFSVL